MASNYKQVLIDIENNKKKFKQEKFNQWINSYSEDNIPIKKIIQKICSDVIESVQKNNLQISNEKQLKNEIATFIYQRSNVL